jgi:hypothetical protein
MLPFPSTSNNHFAAEKDKQNNSRLNKQNLIIKSMSIFKIYQNKQTLTIL